MLRYTFLIVFILIFNSVYGQVKTDLDRSVPLWMEYDTSSNQATLKWIGDENATNYYISTVGTFQNLIPLVTLDGTSTEYNIGSLNNGEIYNYHIRKNTAARGIINIGIEIPTLHTRGRCLIAIDNILTSPLEKEIEQLINDIQMDGWRVDTMHVAQNENVVDVKSSISEWYDSEYEKSQTLLLLGHIPVPYSGNAAHDGHGNHQGAWAADLYYGEMDGNWTDVFVDNTTPSREKNKNIPGDGKFDQTSNPSNLEIEVGRVDFNDLPAFADDEIELTRKYLNKSHQFKIGNKEYPRRALVENNFAGFAEGFGQSGWRNFTTMFGGENVSIQNYEVVLETEKYLCSYACGGGSYTSASGVGTTANLWAAKNMQTVFTMTFGSYFGDWDSQNNFLRGALGSGDILTNAWAGRPVWQFYEMSLGKHIGVSAKKSQDAAGNFYQQGNSAKSAHIALMGDPTLRLHAMKPASNLLAAHDLTDIGLIWDESPDASHGYTVYRREIGSEWLLLAEFVENRTFLDYCVKPNTEYEYMVKAIKLESSGSGSYYNTSLGITYPILSLENLLYTAYYPDADMDGYGNPEGLIYECAFPPGFSENGLDCDDMNSDINPDGIEIPNNGIDEDCDGEDLLVSTQELDKLHFKIYPNPTRGGLFIDGKFDEHWEYRLLNAQGKLLASGKLEQHINLESFNSGVYWIELRSRKSNQRVLKSIMITPF